MVLLYFQFQSNMLPSQTIQNFIQQNPAADRYTVHAWTDTMCLIKSASSRLMQT